jgi:dipeptide transport system ATP-binding protein
VKKGLFAPERLVKALDGVSFTLERGKTLAVVGSPAAVNRRSAVC